MTTTWDLERNGGNDYQYGACPSSLGFDVVVELNYPLTQYAGDDYLDDDQIIHVWMEIGKGDKQQWLCIKKSLPSDILKDLAKCYTPEPRTNNDDDGDYWYDQWKDAQLEIA
jgi:hypothetical protein